MATSGRNPDTGKSSPFSEQLVQTRTPVVSVSSTDPLNILRDQVVLVNNGTVTSTDSEFLVTAPASGDSALLNTALRGRYEAGYAAEVGVGVRLNARATGGTVKWGGFDTEDGVLFALDDDGLAFQILRDSTTTLDVALADANVDRLDGTGPSGIDVSASGGIEGFVQEGHIWQIRFTWYGYGMIEWAIVDQVESNTEQKVWAIHRAKVAGTTSIKDPHLPVGVSAADDASVYVGGRQYSVLGPISQSDRNIGDIREQQTVTNDDTWYPLMAIRRDLAKDWSRGIRIVSDDFEIVTDRKMIVQIFVGPTVTGGSWVEVSNSDGSSAVEVNTTCTGITFPGGTFPNQTVGLDPLIFTGSTGPSRSSTSVSTTKRTELPGEYTMILAARVPPSAAAGDATVDTVFDWLEIR